MLRLGGMNVNNKLFTRDFSLLWLGKSVSQLGDGAGFIGLMWWVQTTTGSATVLGLMAMVSTLVRVLLSPVSGVVADRFHKKKIIVITDFIRGLIYCLLAYLVYSSRLTVPLLLTFSALNALNSVFFGPAISSTVPLLVKPDNLPQANSFLQMTSQIVSIVSYTAGGVLVALLGVPLLLLVDGVSFILSAISEMFINIPLSQGTVNSIGKGAFVSNLKEGLQYVRANTVLLEVMKIAAVLNFVMAPMFILLPKFVNIHLGAAASMYGYMLACMMAGTFLASLIVAFTKFVQRNVWIVIYGVTIQGVLLLGLILLPRHMYYGHLALFLFSGLINGIVNVYFSALMQRITAPEHMGKVYGLVETMSSGLQPLSQGLTGFIGDRLSIPVIFGASSILEAAWGIKFSLVPNLRQWLNPESAAPEHTAAAPVPATD